ncbi:MAG: DUF2924 domain-containing protein [Phycisphaerae bacterium]
MNVKREMAMLEQLTVGELQQRYAGVFGEQPRSRHKAYLVRKISWRMQANEEGGLSERALARAAKLADPAEARVTPPRERLATAPVPPLVTIARNDPRLPPVGVAITREYKGRTLTVTVLHDGFEFEGERYTSLSAVAKAVTGSHMNGFRFFGLEAKR